MAKCIYIVDTDPILRHAFQHARTRQAAMRVTVKKWGNSAAVRIPAPIMKATRLSLEEAVDVREEAGRIVIEPVRQKTYDLRKLLKGVTKKNLHKEVDFGPAQGKEVW